MQLSYAPARTYEESANQQTYPGLVSCGHRELAILWAGKRGATTRRATGAACPARLPRKRRKEGRGTCYNLFPRLSRGKVLHQTDGYLRLVFSAHRSIPAFPTPLRRVIGHHWPWYVARANGFCGNRWRGRVGSRAQIRRTCESPRHRAAPYCHHTRCGEINLTAESLADDRHGGMNSLLFPNRRIPGRHGKFRTRRSCALRNQINSKPRSHSSGRQRAGHGAGRPAI
jgi:hypothetical protein